MPAEPASPNEPDSREFRRCQVVAGLAAVVGLALLAHSAWSTSATYDEVAYLKIAARWWRTGDQSEITRMGSPLTFWKLQQAPTLFLLDWAGWGAPIDDPEVRQAELLPILRTGALWVWLAAFTVTAGWSRRLYGPRAMALAAWLFALSPNLLAHGALVTMELPIVATSAGVMFFFWRFLRDGGRRDFWASAACCGLAFACKSTAALWPPILGLAWLVDEIRNQRVGPVASARRVVPRMAGFVAVVLLVDLVVTGFAVLPTSHSAGGGHPAVEARLGRWPALARVVSKAIEVPVPQDWVGFATQVRHQRSGGPSYLLGERRTRGWWYYYLVALAVKVPLAFWAAAAVRARLPDARGSKAWVLPFVIGAFLAVTAAGSSRNYGVRYLLPVAPLAIVWVSALAGRNDWRRSLVWLAVVGQGIAVGAVHPNELTYFNLLAGGRNGGRGVLADSNLDWGQGLKALARLQDDRPEFRDLTFYYFGDTDPRFYGVSGERYVVDAGERHPGLPPELSASTRFVAVSASLQYGPWGPPGYFRALDGLRPVASTDDTTIAVYEPFLKR